MKSNICKKSIYILAVSTFLAACGGKDKGKSSFQLSGTFTNAAKGDVIYFEELAPGAKVTLDSALIDDKGNFSFTHASPSAGFYRVKVNEQNFAMLVLDSTQKIVLTGDYKNIGNTYQTTGSEDTEIFLEFNKLGKEIQQRTDSMQQAFQAKVGTMKMDSVRMDSLNKVFGEIYNKLIDVYQERFAGLVTKAKSSLAVLAGIQQLNPNKYLSLYKEVDIALTAKYPNSKYLANLKKDIAAFEMQSQKASKLAIGSVAPDFSLTTPEGKPLALSSFRDKVVLVDFWASWCGPCRKENPNVVAMYKKYHNKGFEIYSVSLDDNKDKWLKAIEADGLIWNHASDLRGWDNQAAKLYGVDAIPFTLLLDKQGKVIGKGLLGKELEQKIAEALAAK
ncbi:MAG TPA: TlpA disulfide reductase family protein [Bacteroidia bacterium]